MKTVLFAHLSTFEVKEGDILKQGDKIGLMGNTGHSYGAHLHMTVADSEQTEPWWLADSCKVKACKASTDEYLAGGRSFKDSRGWQDKDYSTGWLGYENHYAYDLVSTGEELPYVVWAPKQLGKVVKVLDYGDVRYGKTVLVHYPYTPPKAKAPETYTVQSGDSLWSITERFCGNGSRCNELAKANGLTLDSVIHAGQVLALPWGHEPPKTHKVKKGESWWSIAQSELGNGARYQELAKLNGLDASQTIHAGQVLKLPK